MDFSALPPEVVSARIHAGPGAESLIEASGAWQRLGTSLEESAATNAAALSSLNETWQGPSAAAMAESVEPYLSWLRSTAQQCQQIAAGAQDAVAAFISVRAAVVPLALVRANRIRLAQLWATNQFGINLPAIAETEDEYLGMWANNSAAMSRYLAASAQATTLPLFSSPGRDCQSGGFGRPSQCGVVGVIGDPGDYFGDGRCQLPDLVDHLGDPGLRPDQRLGRIGQRLCLPVRSVRFSDQPAQLPGAVERGPVAADGERRHWPGAGRGPGRPGRGSGGERARSAPPECRQNSPRRSVWVCRWAS